MAEPTDYDTIAERYAAEIDQRPWNALYERPATLALLPDVRRQGCAGLRDVDMAGTANWLSANAAPASSGVRPQRAHGRVWRTARSADRARIIYADVSDLRDVLADSARSTSSCRR